MKTTERVEKLSLDQNTVDQAQFLYFIFDSQYHY